MFTLNSPLVAADGTRLVGVARFGDGTPVLMLESVPPNLSPLLAAVAFAGKTITFPVGDPPAPKAVVLRVPTHEEQRMTDVPFMLGDVRDEGPIRLMVSFTR